MGSCAERLALMRRRLEEQRLDGMIVSQPETRYYLSGYTGHDLPPGDSAGYLFITPQRALLLTDRRTSEQAEREAEDYEVAPYEAGALGPESVAAAITASGSGRVGFEGKHLPYGVWQRINCQVSGVYLVDASGIVDGLRAIKNTDELERLQTAIDVLDDCYDSVVARLRPGVTEREVARWVHTYLQEHADGPAFPAIVASGIHGSMPHAVPSDRPIAAGEAITIDIGARARGYASDMTRTICLGQPSDPKLQTVFDLVLESQEFAEATLKPGMTGCEADGLARSVLERGDLAQYFTHSLGHGIGLEVHEPPWLSSLRGLEPLAPGMVFSIEPGVYIPGWGGVRIEDLVVMDASGPRVLCHAPKALVVMQR